MVRLMLGKLPCCPSEAVGKAVWDLYLASIMRSGEYNEPPSLIAATGVLNRPITVVRVSASCVTSCLLMRAAHAMHCQVSLSGFASAAH